MATDKEAIAIVLDVGPSMSQAPPGTATALQSATNAITMILQRKIFCNSKDEVALVLFGTPDTANDLAEDDMYENITLASPMGLPDFQLLEYIQNEIQPSDVSGDFIDALVVAMDHLMKGTTGKKFGGKRLIIFSDFGGEFGDDQINDIIGGMKKEEVFFNVIGPDLSDEDGDEDDARPGAANGHIKEKTPQQRAGEALVKHIINELDGECYSFSEALPALSFFQTRKVKSVPWKAELEIGPSLKIAVQGFNRTTIQRAPPFKDCYAKDIDAEVVRNRSYHLNDEASTEVDYKEDTIPGHRYGNTLVPFGEDDIANMKLKTEKCFKVLGFTSASNIKRHHYLGTSCQSFVAEKEDEAAAVALSSLIKALYETDMVAIVRKVYRANLDPKLGFLSPHIKSNYECLFFNELPYMEDLRQFTFGSLPLEDDSETNKKYAPTAEQLEAMDDLITTMDLSKKGDDDEEEEKSEALKPKLTFNPHLQRLYQCLTQKGLNPDDPLPELPAVIADYLKPPQEVLTACEEGLEKIKKNFKMKVVEKKKDGEGEKMFQDGTADAPVAKRPKLDDDLGGGMAGLAKSIVKEVGTVTPVEDFRAMISQKDEDRFEEACKQMKMMIIQIIMDSFGPQFYSKAMDCLKAFREETIKNSEPEVFNNFLTEMKDTLSSKNRRDFWDRVITDKVSLISKDECEDSKVSRGEADQFLEKQVAKEETQEMETEDADDLLDQI